MFKALPPAVLEEMLEAGEILLTVKAAWEGASVWSAVPNFISYCIGTERTHIFTCYCLREGVTLQLTNMEPTKLISGEKPLVDAYMYVALKGLIEFANSLGIERLIIDSYVPSAADYMLDLGFYITPKGTFSSGGVRGYKILKEQNSHGKEKVNI